MRSGVRILFIGLCLSAAAFAVLTKTGPLPVLAQTEPEGGAAVSKEVCLKCHGPYAKLAGAPAAYAAPSGEKINPHVYVPHATREATAVPECTNCHQPHAIPPDAAQIKAQPAPDAQWCYTACHHSNDFQPCKSCHKQAGHAE
jgi:hypothetical protein